MIEFPKNTGWSENVPIFKETEKKDLSRYTYQISYSGKSNNNIHLIYREFVDNMARDAFKQEYQFNLDEGNEIRIKSIKIKIINATNSLIEFIVLSDDDCPWVQ